MVNNNNPKGRIFAITPGDVFIQIVPKFLNTNNNKVSIPDPELGYTIPLKLFLVDQYKDENSLDIFCGVFEVATVFFNESIRRDLLDELYRDNVQFNIFIRVRDNSEGIGPKRLKEYLGCHLYRQQLSIPEVGLTTLFRYYFTNTSEPWEISEARIDALRPPNQYFYDYAVSKAIKNLQYPINDVVSALKVLGKYPENTIAQPSTEQIITAKEFIELVKKGDLH